VAVPAAHGCHAQVICSFFERSDALKCNIKSKIDEAAEQELFRAPPPTSGF